MNPSSFFKEINSWQDFVGATNCLDKKGKGDPLDRLPNDCQILANFMS